MTTRKRTVVASSLLALLVGSIGVACGSDTAEMPAIPDGSAPTSTTPPPPPPVEAGGDAADAGELVGLPPPEPPKPNELTDPFGVFVSKGAPDGGDGTRAKPFNTISAGLEQAATDKKRLYVCAGTYPEAIELKNGVSVIANLSCVDPLDWKLNGAHTTLNSPTSPAVTASGITLATRVEGLDVIAPAGSPAAPSSIALLATGSTGLTFSNGKLEAGIGRDGVNGVTPPNLVVTSTLPGGALPPAECLRADIIAPTRCTTTNYNHFPGRLGGTQECREAGSNRLVGTSSGGNGGSSNIFRPNLSPGASQGLAGSPSGADGTNGMSSTGGTFSESGFAQGDGTDGTNGGVGAGGTGGTANVLQEPHPGIAGVVWGWAQGGGGAGGCPGMAGTAGTGGGASIAALLSRSPVRFEKVALASANGGRGGFGSFGSLPTPGQATQDPVGTVSFPLATAGSPGRPAGISGHGAGGPSVAIAHDAAGRPVLVDSPMDHGNAGASPPASSEAGRTIPAAAPAVGADKFEY